MDEHSYIRAVHAKLPRSSNFLSWKINDKFAGGVPDALYAGSRAVLFVEYKYVRALPAKLTTQLRYKTSPLQLGWLNKISNLNNDALQCALVVGHEQGAAILGPDLWSTNITLQQFKNNKVHRDQVAKWIQRVCIGAQHAQDQPLHTPYPRGSAR